MTKPNSDNSSRQVRRREERDVAKAAATIARANAQPRPAATSPTGGMVVSIDEMTQLIVERDIQISRLKKQIAAQQTQLMELQGEVGRLTTETVGDEGTPAPTGAVDDTPEEPTAESTPKEGEPDGKRKEDPQS